MTPCPVCGKQPVLRTGWHPTFDALFGARYSCAPWWWFGFAFHKVTTIKWNVKGWADLAIQRAAEEWNE